jgi:hypothetical protein
LTLGYAGQVEFSKVQSASSGNLGLSPASAAIWTRSPKTLAWAASP